MVFDFKKINQEYPVKGVIHVGAFAGEELNQYRTLGLSNTVMFEPQEDLYNLIKSRCIFNEKIHNVALGSESCTKEMYISFREGGVSQGCGASSSLLKPKKHLEEHPEVTFPETRMVEVRTLDEYYDPQYNFLNIDVQGYELEVLKGATRTIENIDAMILEVNRAEVYEGCPLIEDIDDFLEDVGFVRIAEIWQSKSWGDALYARR
jgi:FkbM family methyltransferase